MKFWELYPRKDVWDNPNNPWKERWDCAFGFIVRAETEIRARVLAAARRGEEGPVAWLSPDFSICKELSPTDPEEVLIRDYNAG